MPRYEDICDLGISECSAQIEKDLLRTFPGNERMGGKDGTDGIDSLRRILTAYSLRNPSVGYCQSMNFLVATLLLFCEEREAFWILATLIEDKLSPDFYSMTMLGLQTDLLVFDSMMDNELPKISEFLKKEGIELSLAPFATKWLMTIFCNVLPLETTLRVWDCLLLEGSVVLFRAGVGMLRVMQKDLLSCPDAMSVQALLVEAPTAMLDCDALIKATFNDSVSDSTVVARFVCEVRAFHRASVDRDHGGRSAGIAEDEKAHSRMSLDSFVRPIPQLSQFSSSLRKGSDADSVDVLVVGAADKDEDDRLVPVIDLDALPNLSETLAESPVPPTGTGVSVNMRQSNRFKRFSAILSAEAAAAAVDAADVTSYLPRRMSLTQNSSPAAAALVSAAAADAASTI